MKVFHAIFANTYSLLLQTQNCHWHTQGPHFYVDHKFFEEVYQSLFKAVDELAEVVVMKGHEVPVTFAGLDAHATVLPIATNASAEKMYEGLIDGFKVVIKNLEEGLKIVKNEEDYATEAIFINQLGRWSKFIWMLQAQLTERTS